MGSNERCFDNPSASLHQTDSVPDNDFCAGGCDISHCYQQLSFVGPLSYRKTEFLINCFSWVQSIYCKTGALVACEKLETSVM